MSAGVSQATWDDILDFVKDHAAGLSYPEQTHDACDRCQETQQLPIGAREVEDVMVLHALGLIAKDRLLLLLLLSAVGCGRSCWRARGRA